MSAAARGWRPALRCCLLLFACARACAADDAPSARDSNITYISPHSDHEPSIFSPRMDFEQWKPLTGRGDPLQNDPTYDYEPPNLDRVHYWIDSASAKPEEKLKSEVLVLGISSKKPSVVQQNVKRESTDAMHKYTNIPKIPNYMHFQFSRPIMPVRHRPTSHVSFPPHVVNKVKYEDFSYNINDSPIPMTILVPPPPPPPGHIQNNFYQLLDEQRPTPEPTSEATTPNPPEPTKTVPPETPPNLFVQEANLIYQSSTVDENWDHNVNTSKGLVEESINSDYAGWGPTVPPELEESNNDTHNVINSDHFEIIHHPFSFYQPMFSEAPPPPQPTPIALFETTPSPTVSPPTLAYSEKETLAIPTMAPNTLVTEFQPTETPYSTFDEPKTEKQDIFEPTPLPPEHESTHQSIFAMLGPMLGMPMADGPQRLEDNLYEYGKDHLHVFKPPVKSKEEWDKELETMQTMQPPPVTVTTERMPINFPPKMSSGPTGSLQNLLHKEQFPFQFTSGMMKNPIFKPIAQTPPPTTTIHPLLGNLNNPVDINVAPMYLIIQGHSKVKTYSSKKKETVDANDAINNEIPQSKESQQVKHLHPLKDTKTVMKSDVKLKEQERSKKSRSLKNLVSEGVGSIEIQETDLGIQYDVSDGSEVPAEIYRKGFVDTELNAYGKARTNKTSTDSARKKRQLDLEDILPDEERIEEIVYNYLKKKSNEKGITGLIAAAVTSQAAEAVDDLEDDEEEGSSAR